METAIELLRKDESGVYNEQDIVYAMIEFAKLHVQEALKQASEKAYAQGRGSSLTTKSSNFFYTFGGHIGEIDMNKNSILNAYPLTNIK